MDRVLLKWLNAFCWIVMEFPTRDGKPYLQCSHLAMLVQERCWHGRGGDAFAALQYSSSNSLPEIPKRLYWCHYPSAEAFSLGRGKCQKFHRSSSEDRWKNTSIWYPIPVESQLGVRETGGGHTPDCPNCPTADSETHLPAFPGLVGWQRADLVKEKKTVLVCPHMCSAGHLKFMM